MPGIIPGIIEVLPRDIRIEQVIEGDRLAADVEAALQTNDIDRLRAVNANNNAFVNRLAQIKDLVMIHNNNAVFIDTTYLQRHEFLRDRLVIKIAELEGNDALIAETRQAIEAHAAERQMARDRVAARVQAEMQRVQAHMIQFPGNYNGFFMGLIRRPVREIRARVAENRLPLLQIPALPPMIPFDEPHAAEPAAQLRQFDLANPTPVNEDPAQFESYKDRFTCPICTMNERNTILNCGHTLCSDCARRLQSTTNRCYLCRGPITDMKKMYINKYLKYKNKYLQLKNKVF